MEIADEDGHRGLAYVAATAAHGHRISVAEFEAYMSGPTRHLGTRTSMPRLAGLASLVSTSLTVQTSKPESHTEFFRRVRWLTQRRDKTLGLTPLGRAVLASLDAGDPGDLLNVVALEPEDPLAYARVVTRLAQAEGGLVVDPFLSFEGLTHLIQFTSVDRILIGPKADRKAIAGTLELLTSEARHLDARVSKVLHDRFFIPPEGEIVMLGTSLNGIGKKLTAMVSLTGDSAEVIRKQYESVWEEAEPIKQSDSRADEVQSGEEA